MTTNIAEELQKPMGYLYDRWQDEKAYEDFSDYEKHAEIEVTERGGIFESLKANAGSQPFELKFYYKHTEYRMEVTATNITTHKRDHAGEFIE